MTAAELLQLSDLNLAESYREAMRWSGGESFEGRGALLTAGPLPHPMMNIAFRLDPGLEAGEFMAAVADFYAERERPYMITARAHGDEDVAKLARAEDLLAAGAPPAMVLLETLEAREPPPGASIRQVRDRKGMRDFKAVAAESWTTYGLEAEVTEALFEDGERLLLPHIVAAVAYLEGTPAGAALVILSHAVAGIYWVSTVSGARRLGLGEACTRWVTRAAFERGARVVLLQASVMGEAIYRRMGFTALSSYQQFVRLDPARGGAAQ